MIRARQNRGVLELCIDRPDKRNALSHAMYDELTRLLAAAQADAGCAAVILHGAGGIFTAGADIQDFQTRRGHEDSPAVRFLRQLAALDVPVIAAVEGPALTLRAYDGRVQTVRLKTTLGLKVGQHTSWCEEDCRELHVWAAVPVERVGAGK